MKNRLWGESSKEDNIIVKYIHGTNKQTNNPPKMDELTATTWINTNAVVLWIKYYRTGESSILWSICKCNKKEKLIMSH